MDRFLSLRKLGMERRRRRLLPLLVAWVLASAATASSVARADRCSASVESQIRMSEVIFEGRLISVEGSILRVDIIALYKGQRAGRIEVRMNRRSILLGGRVGDVLLIMARHRRGHLYLVPCGNSGVLARVPETLGVLERLGFPRRPIRSEGTRSGAGASGAANGESER